MSTKSTTIARVATGARLVIGAVVAVGCVAAVVAATALPWPEVGASAAEVHVSAVPGDAVLSCSGSFRALGRNSASADEVESAGIARTTVGGDPEAPERSMIETPGLVGGEGAAVFTGAPQDRESAMVAAAESIRLAEEDLSGFAATGCLSAASESWIVGGSTETGAGDVLVVSNPGSVTATVSLAVYGAERAPVSLVVPAGTQASLPFASVAGDAEEPIVRITAEGAPVRTVLQSSLMRTLDPAGIDLQGATTPSEKLVFAGMRVVTPSTGSATNVLRVLAPDEDAVAHVIVRDDGGETVNEMDVELAAGAPLEVALADLKNGIYSVEATADTPLVGGVWQTTGTGGGTDFAWMTPAPELGDDVVFAVPAGPAARLHILGDPDAERTVTLSELGGDERSTTIPAGGSQVVSLHADTVYRLSADGSIRAAVGMAGEDQLAGWPVEPSGAAAKDITVIP